MEQEQTDPLSNRSPEDNIFKAPIEQLPLSEQSSEKQQSVDADMVDDTEATINSAQPTAEDIGAVLFKAIQKSDAEKPQLPPLDSIPSLQGLIKGPDSMHQHKFDDSCTVWAKLSRAEDTPTSERTHEQVELMTDVERLKAFTPYGSAYMDVYMPAELHDLVGKLDMLRAKNRPDFNSVEAKIIDTLIRGDDVPSSIRGVAKRAEQAADNRRGMQWETLIKLAGVANDVLAQKMASGSDSRKYLIAIDRDPDYVRGDASSTDFKNVYQFVATSHALDMYGQRNSNVKQLREQTFLANYDAILEWYKSAKEAIDQLPRDVEFAESLIPFDKRSRNPARSGIQFRIQKLIETMEKRHDSKDMFGKFKSYKTDPAGAINLQLLIGHQVEAIRAKLGSGVHPSEEDITPLEGFDF